MPDPGNIIQIIICFFVHIADLNTVVHVIKDRAMRLKR